MAALIVLLALIGLSSSASILQMDDKDFQKAMMDQMYSSGSHGQMMGIRDIRATPQRQQKYNDAETLGVDGAEDAGVREGREAEYAVNDPSEVEADQPNPAFNMFGRGMMTMAFPDMFGDAPEQAAPHANAPARHPTNYRAPANNGRRGGSASAASATSFSRGANSGASSQGQAFNFGNW